ncbi:MBL fold metallo-hydrolase [Amycolatopsis thailandensis]|uniref:MBL fold metallo-hydrolase n=1 Tax=Amycolatopsis thailandensis TaxID=589330 RepID=A0A229SB10_9PSEU|nr:MBL fold metallo-hydrolase [Amycolatopsis thailandensis]OXM56096.1 MBL fold metallo-hydrolase [Amycolatopsis thailandensis]
MRADWTIGAVDVHRVDEIALPPETGSWLLPGATEEVIARESWLADDFADERGLLRLASHTFALSAGGTRILVDTGIGNGKRRANPAWDDLSTDYPRRLADAGFQPDSVDLVILTHLHTDHVGWNTRADNGTWVPNFPNARYLTARAEWEFWAGHDLDAPRRQMFDDSVFPIHAAGLLDLVDVGARGAEILPGLRLLPTPGHTPGHVSVEVSDAGNRALITGDCLHHPVQFANPGIGSCVDIDEAQAETTRRELLSSLANTETLVLGSHFAPPTAGFVRSHGDGYRLITRFGSGPRPLDGVAQAGQPGRSWASGADAPRGGAR